MLLEVTDLLSNDSARLQLVDFELKRRNERRELRRRRLLALQVGIPGGEIVLRLRRRGNQLVDGILNRNPGDQVVVDVIPAISVAESEGQRLVSALPQLVPRKIYVVVERDLLARTRPYRIYRPS